MKSSAFLMAATDCMCGVGSVISCRFCCHHHGKLSTVHSLGNALQQLDCPRFAFDACLHAMGAAFWAVDDQELFVHGAERQAWFGAKLVSVGT